MNTNFWRTRCVIEVNADLGNELFIVAGNSILPQPLLRQSTWSIQMHVVDVILSELKAEAAEDAHIAGLDTINIFLDRLSLVTYSCCRLLNVVSTCPVSVVPNVEFQIVTHDLYLHVEPQMVLPHHLARFEKLPAESPIHEATHHARKALSEGAAEQHLLHLHIAAERIALSETVEKVEITCPSCNHKWDGPPASRRAVRGLLAQRGVLKGDSDDAIKYRGRVAHGGGKRNLAFYERVTELAGAVEGAILSTIADRSGVKILQRRNVVIGMPIIVSVAIKTLSGFSITTSNWRAPFRRVELMGDVSEDGGAVTWGMPLDENMKAKVDPIGWPD